MYRLGVCQCTSIMAHLKHQVPEDFDKEEVLLLGSPLAPPTPPLDFRQFVIIGSQQMLELLITVFFQKRGLLCVCPPSSSVCFHHGLGLGTEANQRSSPAMLSALWETLPLQFAGGLRHGVIRWVVQHRWAGIDPRVSVVWLNLLHVCTPLHRLLIFRT